MKLIRNFSILLIIFFIQACGLTTKELINDPDKIKNTNIYAVTDRGISISTDGGTKWTIKIPDEDYQGEVLDIISNGSKYQIVTSKGIYSYDKKITLNIKQAITSTEYLAGNRYLTNDSLLFEFENDEQLITINQLPEDSIIVFADELLTVSNNQLLMLDNKNSWQPYFSCKDKIVNILAADDQLLLISEKKVMKLIPGKKEIKKEVMKVSTSNIASGVVTFSDNGSIYLAKGKILKRTSSGETWDEFTEETGYIAEQVHNIQVKGLGIYLATDKGIVYSLNGGETWHKFTKAHGLLSTSIKKVFVQ